MKRFHSDKDDNNEASAQMETVNENGKVPSSRVEAFVALEKWLRWFEIQKECNSM